jgi:molybdopterin synthase catalytic subunit
MTKTKSPEDVMKEFDGKWRGDTDEGEDIYYIDAEWLRSSLASVLLHMAEQMPEKREIHQSYHRDGSLQPGNSLSSVCFTCMQKRWSEEQGANQAIDDCKAILINEAKKITNV